MKAEHVDHMGSDLSVVDAARVSFAKKSAWVEEEGQEPSLSDADKRLITYLAKHRHWSPFAGPKIQLRLTLPIFVARQWEKHRVGAVRGYELYDQNEVSRRYVKDEPQFFIPDVWRAAPDGSIKQGSGGALNDVANAACAFDLKNVIHTCLGAYNNLLRRGVAPEMARMVLPQNMMTQWIETGSLYYWFNLCSLRLDAHAQKEIRDLASQVAVIAAEHFPYSWQALTSARKNDHD